MIFAVFKMAFLRGKPELEEVPLELWMILTTLACCVGAFLLPKMLERISRAFTLKTDVGFFFVLQCCSLLWETLFLYFLL